MPRALQLGSEARPEPVCGPQLLPYHWVPEVGSAVWPGRSCRAVVPVPPEPDPAGCPLLRAAQSTLDRDSLRPGHALLAWYLSCQSKDQVPVKTGMLLQEAHSFMLETSVLIK